MPQMTSTIDYKALAERVAQRAIYADNNADQNNKTWAADLRTVVSLLNGMAGQKPQAEPKLGELMREQRNARIVAGAYPDGNPNAGAIMAQTSQAEPKREPLSELPPLPEPRLIGGIGDYREHWDADQMREYGRAVERAAYERAAQECITTAAELRRCADGCTDGRYDWKADGADDCADAIRALGRQHD